MRLKPLLLTMFMLAGFSMAKAEIVQLGDNDNNRLLPYLPTDTKYNYSYSQQIYTNVEMGKASKTIYSISFYNTMSADTRTIDLYMLNVSKPSFDNDQDWFYVDETNKVFSGDVTFEHDTWTTITLDTPFDYDGSQGLLVAMDDNTGTEGVAHDARFLSAYIYEERSLFDYNDNDYDPTNLSGVQGFLGHERNKIRVNEGEVIGLPGYGYLPTSNFYNYTISQQIYTADEIGDNGTITSLSFFDITHDYERNLELYLVHTDKASFASQSDWLVASSADMVFNGTVSFKKGEWSKIVLDTPFKYNGKDNLAVIAIDRTGTYNESGLFAVYQTDEMQSLCHANDSYSYDISSPISSGWGHKCKSQVKIEIEKGLIGDGGPETHYYLPTNTWYNCSLTEQIYTKEELGDARDLTSIGFFNEGPEMTRNLNIYLVPTYATEFADAYSWIPFSESNLVFSGDVDFLEEDWTLIPFDQPYNYNGKTSLVLVVADLTGSYLPYGPQQAHFRSFYSPKQSLAFAYDDIESFPTPESIMSETAIMSGSKNQIKLNQTDNDLSRPTNLEVRIEPYTAEISWDGEGEMWELQYRYFEGGSWYTEHLTTNYCTITDLRSLSSYYVRVRTIREDGSVSKWTTKFFYTTAPVPYDVSVNTTPTTATITWDGYLPNTYDVMYYNTSNFETVFYDNFEEAGLSDAGWTILTNGTSPYSNGWVRDSDYTFGGWNTATSYSWTSSSGAYHADNWLITPLVDLKGTLSFWQYVTSYRDSYEVKLSTSGTDISDFVYTLRPMAKGETGWNELRFDLSPYEGEKGYIAIHHLDYDQVCLSIDEFRIFTGEMQYVHTDLTELKLEGLQPNTEYGYMIFAHKMSDKSANTELATFTTLPTNPAPSDFAVEPGITTADISWTGYSDSYKVRYRTAEVIEEKPIFFEDFENGLEDKGWLVTTDLEHIEGKEGWFTTDATAENPLATNHSGSNVVSSWTYNLLDYAQNQLISPLVEFKGKLKFWQWTLDGCPDSYAVYLGWGKTAEEYAIHGFPLGLRSLQPGLPGWNEMVFDLTPFEGHQGYICIEHSDFNMYALFIDDFGIYEDVVVAPQGEWQEIETTDPFVTIEGLDRETKYEFEVIGIKAGEEDAASEIATFTTATVIDLVLNTNQNNEYDIKTNNGKYANVTIEGRTLRKDGKWWGICLPFDLELEGSILEGADLRTAEDVKEVDNYLIVDCLTPLTKLEAGVPYIIKWDEGENIVNPVFKEVKVKSGYHPKEFFSGDVIFQGTSAYQRGSDTPADYFYLFDGNLKIAKICLQGHARDAFQSYFYVNPSLNDSKDGIGINVGNIFDTITGVDDVKKAEEPTIIYNVAGQRLQKTQKGINIVNGKKVLVK